MDVDEDFCATAEDLDHMEMDTGDRFGVPLSTFEVEALNASVVSKNTLKRNKWSAGIIASWCAARQMGEGKMVEDYENEELNEILQKFIHEVRKVDGQRYPNTTLVSIMAGLSSILSASRGVSLFKSPLFSPVITALDASMRLSTREGASLKRSSAEFISLEEEEELWTAGCLGDKDPDQLRNTLFYLNGVHFGLRGGEEQCNLMYSQVTIDIVGGKRVVRYSEVSTKTFSGGLKDSRNKPKEVTHFENFENPIYSVF